MLVSSIVARKIGKCAVCSMIGEARDCSLTFLGPPSLSGDVVKGCITFFGHLSPNCPKLQQILSPVQPTGPYHDAQGAHHQDDAAGPTPWRGREEVGGW